MDFSDPIKAQMEGRVVRVTFLAEFRFVSGNVGLWLGSGSLETLDGRSWSGADKWASVSGVGQSINGTAPPTTFTLSGVDPTFAAKAKGDHHEYYNRAVVTYLQFFDDDWSCLGEPFAISLTRMTNLNSKRETGPDGPIHTVTVTGETPFATRRRPKYGFWTDRDQQRRYPGDRGLERVAGIDNKNIRFPDY